MHRLRTGRYRLLCYVCIALVVMIPACAGITYIVQPGDTYSRIAARFSIATATLLAHANIDDPDVICVGQHVDLPDDAVVPAEYAPYLRDGKIDLPRRTAASRDLYAERAKLLAQQQPNRGEKIVAAARAYAGTPYRRGGLSARGIDCSGLVVRAMGYLGKEVPHHAATLYTMGQRVTYEQLQPGDLLFFNTRGNGVSHVAIWIGDNKFIHASSSGRGVRTDALAGYYARRLVGAKRL